MKRAPRAHDTPVFRLSEVLTKLNQGETLDPQALADEFGVNLRTIQRDLKLRFSGLPLVKVNGRYTMDKALLGNLTIRANPAMHLSNCRITNAVRCLPPANKPTTAEIRQCNGHLKAELAAMPKLKVIVALGGVAHQALLWTYGLKLKEHVFGHNVRHALPDGRLLIDSYHCSGYNWRTGRLSRESFEAVFAGVRASLG